MPQEITVHVPEERITEFYECFGRWLSGEDASVVVAPESNRLAWTAADTELALIVWNKLSDPAKRIFTTLMENPEVKIHRDRLAKVGGLENGKYGVAGALAWPGRHAYAVNRDLPIEMDVSENETHYWMEPVIAELFSNARDYED
jgi:hypothetical protein